jgi:uncharacterized protein with HEPN domain
VKDERLYLIHILECIVRVEGYTAGGYDSFLRDQMAQDAVLRNLQILAESTQRLSDGIKASRPSVDWRGVAGLRNRLVHAYLDIDPARIWEIVSRSLPALKAAVQALLDAAPPPAGGR